MSNENNEKPMSNEEAEKQELIEAIIADYRARKEKPAEKFATELAEEIPEFSAKKILDLMTSNKKIVAQDKEQLGKIISAAIRNYGNRCSLNFIDVSNVTDMSQLFSMRHSRHHFNGDISQWDVSNVKNMASMFVGSEFNGDISKWNVSKVETMNGMFFGSKFNGDINKWDISSDTDITGMFKGSLLEKKGEIPDLKNFDVSGTPVVAKNKAHLSSLIYLAILKHGPKVDLNFIDVSKVTDMQSLFFMSPFEGDISKWNISCDADITDMFKGSQLEEKGIIPDLKNFDVSGAPVVAKNEKHLSSLVRLAISKYGPCVDLNFIDVSRISVMDYLFCESPFDGNISKWDVSNVKSMKATFCTSNFNGDISQWNVSNVTNMSEMFEHTRFNGDISQWNVSSVTDMRNMFYLSRFNGDISQWDVSNVERMDGMFGLSLFNGDISTWDVSNVKSMNCMFMRSSFKGDISSWKLSDGVDPFNIDFATMWE